MLEIIRSLQKAMQREKLEKFKRRGRGLLISSPIVGKMRGSMVLARARHAMTVRLYWAMSELESTLGLDRMSYSMG